MKAAIKKVLKSGIRFAVNVAMQSTIGRYSIDQVLDLALSRSKTVQHQGLALTFAVPNKINLFRVDSFSIKEPETLEWIDAIPQGSVLWDIGANIGFYTCLRGQGSWLSSLCIRAIDFQSRTTSPEYFSQRSDA